MRLWCKVQATYLRILVCARPARSKHVCALAVAINQIMEARRLSQSAAARLLGINQPKVSALVNYRLEGFFGGAHDEFF